MIALIYKGLLDVLNRLTSARAAGLDNLDAAISSRLSGTDSRLNNLNATITSRLSSTDARLNTLDTLAAGVIKSVQRGSTVITGNTTTQAITTVDSSKAILIHAVPSTYNYGGQLSAANQITFYRASGDGGTPTVQWQVVEFK